LKSKNPIVVLNAIWRKAGFRAGEQIQFKVSAR
jgi:hypothetical protein